MKERFDDTLGDYFLSCSLAYAAYGAGVVTANIDTIYDFLK